MSGHHSESRALAKGLAFCSPWLVGFCLFTLTPVVLSLYYSFCDYSLLQPPVFRGMANYRDMIHDPVFWISLRNTFYYASMALPAGVLVSIGLALMLNSSVRGLALWRTIIFLPSLVPAVASALLWMWILNAKYGMLNGLLDRIHIVGPQWLGTGLAMPSLAMISLWGVGNTVVIYLAGLQDVPRDLYEAAEIDGAMALQRMWHVTLPMISPVIFFNLVMAIIGTFQVFVIPMIMTQGGPDRQTTFYTMYLYSNAFEYLKMGYASALAWAQLLIILSLTALAFLSSRRWVHYQGK
jgi:multiple sugar transport system permease protein